MENKDNKSKVVRYLILTLIGIAFVAFTIYYVKILFTTGEHYIEPNPNVKSAQTYLEMVRCLL